MNKTEIITQLFIEHNSFWDTSLELPSPTIAKNGKWSVAQNVEHINLTLSRLGKFLSLPKPDIEANFGLSGRPSIGNEEFIKSYQNALTSGLQSPTPFVPEYNTDSSLQELITNGKKILENVISNLQNWSEEDMEQYQCPHPALGKITVKEMFYFTIFHVQYHQQIINR